MFRDRNNHIRKIFKKASMSAAGCLLAIPAWAIPPAIIEGNVTVVNDESDPVPVLVQGSIESQGSKQVMNIQVQVSMDSGFALPVELMVVPEGKRLVITTAALDTGLSNCSFELSARIRIDRTESPFLVMFPLGAVSPMPVPGAAPRFVNQAVFPVQIYAEPLDTILFDLIRSDDACITLARLSLSGYFEDDV